MTLFPEISPFETGRLETGDGHSLYWERCGRKGGVPAVFLHGGPGSGCTPTHRRYFDPDVFDLVLLDQRGCGRSTPLFSLENNTTPHLVADLESLRRRMGFEGWVVMGPSWGSTLALAYAQAHPESFSGLLVEGVFLTSEAEHAWWHAEPGAPSLFPDAFADFLAGADAPAQKEIPAFLARMRDDMLAEINSGLPALDRLEDPETPISTLRQSLVYRWTEYEDRISWIEASPADVRSALATRGKNYVAGHSLIEAHYFANHCFLEPDQLVRDAGRLAGIPMEIVQSRYDTVCPADAAWRLKHACPHAELTMVPANGHAMTERVFPAVRTALSRLAAKI
jgi:proline iminopeptidase